jgi:hypothetical protein
VRAVFGRGDWVANGVLFTSITGMSRGSCRPPWWRATFWRPIRLWRAYPARPFQSAWMEIIVHSVQSVFVIAVVLALVLK